jgi:ribonuclease T2
MKKSGFLMALFLLMASFSRAEGFDYYTLAVTLTPAFCDLNPKRFNTLQCRDRRAVEVHGLWPERLKGEAPAYCSGETFAIAPRTENLLKRIMPDVRFRRYQWDKHGRCSGLSPEAYFSLLAREFDELKWPDQFKSSGRDVVVERSVILNELKRLNPGLSSNGIVLRCEGKDRPPLLTEVRICLSAAGTPVECLANYRPNCPAAVRIRAWR